MAEHDKELEERLAEAISGGKKPPPKPVEAPKKPKGGWLAPEWLQRRPFQILAVVAVSMLVIGGVFAITSARLSPWKSPGGLRLFEGEPHRLGDTGLSLEFNLGESEGAAQVFVKDASGATLASGAVAATGEASQFHEVVRGIDIALRVKALHEEPPMPAFIEVELSFQKTAGN